MNELRKHIIKELGVVSEIDAETEFNSRVEFLVRKLEETNLSGYVLGISGGQDSLLAGLIAQEAVKLYRLQGGEATFLALRLPYATQDDAEDVELALDFIKPDKVLTHNILDAVYGHECAYLAALGHYMPDYHKGNVKARERMVAQYVYAGANDMLVIGTDHAAEAVTGFFTKFGDGAADVLPLSGLTKRQGKEILRYLGAPERIITKAPTADLLDAKPGQADEAELGLTYDQIDTYLEGGAQENGLQIAQRIEKRYLDTMHKRLPPVAYERTSL